MDTSGITVQDERTFPEEVRIAILRFSEGADTPVDRAILEAYLSSGMVDPQVAPALRQMVAAMKSGGDQPGTTPSLGDAFGNYLSWGDQQWPPTGPPGQPGSQILPTNLPPTYSDPINPATNADVSWDVGRARLPSNVGLGQRNLAGISPDRAQQAPANLPTPPQSMINPTGDPQASYNAGRANLPSDIGLGGRPPLRAGAPTPPPIGLPGTSDIRSPAQMLGQNAIAARGQVGIGMEGAPNPSVMASNTGRHGIGVDRGSRPDRNGGGGENWKGVLGRMGGDSAFADINPGYLSAYVSSPQMFANEMMGGGTGHEMRSMAMAPTASSALALSTSGLLGGGRGHGLGGPASSGGKLARAEGMMNYLDQTGAYIDPASVYTRTLHRAGKTDPSELGSDINTQVDTTKKAILAPLVGIVSQEEFDATSNMIDRMSVMWLDGIAHGAINPDVTSFPQYLRDQHKGHYLGR